MSAVHKVAALAYEGLCTFEFGIVVELFGLPRPELDHWYRFEVCGLEKRPLRATGGVSVLPRRGLKGLLDADTIIIPGWRNADEPPPQRLIRMLITAHRQGARLVSICSGIFVLAATGGLKLVPAHAGILRILGAISRSPSRRSQPLSEHFRVG